MFQRFFARFVERVQLRVDPPGPWEEFLRGYHTGLEQWSLWRYQKTVTPFTVGAQLAGAWCMVCSSLSKLEVERAAVQFAEAMTAVNQVMGAEFSLHWGDYEYEDRPRDLRDKEDFENNLKQLEAFILVQVEAEEALALGE